MGPSVTSDSLIASYGKPRRMLGTRRRQCNWFCPPSTAELEAVRTAGLETATASLSCDSTGTGAAATGAAQSWCSGSLAGSGSTGSIVMLHGLHGYRSAKESEDVLAAELPGSLTLGLRPGSSPSAPPRGSGKRANLSVDQLKQITHSRPQSVPSAVTVLGEALLGEPHCIACHGGFCASRAAPHGPESYCDRSRCRVGSKPKSPPNSPSEPKMTESTWSPASGGSPTYSDADARQATPPSQLRRRKGRGQSMEHELGRVGDLDMADNDEFDGEPGGELKRAMSPLGAAWTGTRAQKHEKKSRNPFVECMDREQRLTMERQWLLEEDGMYMQERKKDLKHYRVQNKIDVQEEDDDTLYEKAVFYGPYSMNMHDKKMGHKLRVRLDRPELTRSKHQGKRSSTAHKKGDTAESLHHPTSALQVKALNRELETSAKNVERQFEGEGKQQPQKKKKAHAKDNSRRNSTSKPTAAHAQSAGANAFRMALRGSLSASVEKSRAATSPI